MIRTFRIVVLALCLGQAATALPWQKANGPEFRGDVRFADVKNPLPSGPARLRVWVYLPPSLAAAGSKFPVVYACDGQELFHPGPFGDWEVDERLDTAIRGRQLRPLIIVGVEAPDHQFRLRYYTARKTHNPRTGASEGGDAELYCHFLISLKEEIDRDFPTDPGDSALLGASLGGLFALYAGFAHSDIFGRDVVMSPSLWWEKRSGLGELLVHAGAGPRFVWLDIGSDERSDGGAAEARENVENAVHLSQSLRAHGCRPEVDFHFEIIPGAQHRSSAWSQRLTRALQWIYRAPP